MRGGPARALLRSVIYVLLAFLLTLVGTAAYASQNTTSLPSAAVSRQQPTIARALPSATPSLPVTTVLAEGHPPSVSRSPTSSSHSLNGTWRSLQLSCIAIACCAVRALLLAAPRSIVDGLILRNSRAPRDLRNLR